MISVQWLRYGGASIRKITGFVVTVPRHTGCVCFGLRWSRRVFNANAGPFFRVY